jgi:hypothetical protein
MDDSVDYHTWVREYLRLNVSAVAVECFKALDEESRHYLMQQSDDMIKMVLVCFERVFELGGTVKAWNLFELSGHEMKCVTFEGMFCVILDGESRRYAMNHYGLMQLSEWLQRLQIISAGR